MFLADKIDLTTLIITLVAVIFFVLILLVLLISRLKGKKDDLATGNININPKLFKTTLSTFFSAVGGTDNVKKIELDEKENRLILHLENVDLAANLNSLTKFGLIKKEYFDDKIFLYFIDTKDFYNSLFGK